MLVVVYHSYGTDSYGTDSLEPWVDEHLAGSESLEGALVEHA